MPAEIKPLRTAFIGLGAIAHEHMPFIRQSAQAELAGLCDLSPALGKAFASYHQIDVPCFTDLDKMIAATSPDILHVLTPPPSHATIVSKALNGGIHVICEKPMTGTADETAALQQLAGEKGRVLVESRNLLWNDPVIELLNVRDSGRLGEVRECEIRLHLDFLSGPFGDENLSGTTGLPGGAVHDFLPHLTYLFQTLTNVEAPEIVTGELRNISGNRRAEFDFLDASLRSGDVRGHLIVATDMEPARFRVSLYGTQGSAEIDLYNPYLRFDGPPNIGAKFALGQIKNGFGQISSGITNLRNKVGQKTTYHGLPRMLEDVYRSISEGSPPPITPEEILGTARLLDRIVGLASR